MAERSFEPGIQFSKVNCCQYLAACITKERLRAGGDSDKLKLVLSVWICKAKDGAYDAYGSLYELSDTRTEIQQNGDINSSFLSARRQSD